MNVSDGLILVGMGVFTFGLYEWWGLGCVCCFVGVMFIAAACVVMIGKEPVRRSDEL